MEKFYHVYNSVGEKTNRTKLFFLINDCIGNFLPLEPNNSIRAYSFQIALEIVRLPIQMNCKITLTSLLLLECGCELTITILAAA